MKDLPSEGGPLTNWMYEEEGGNPERKKQWKISFAGITTGASTDRPDKVVARRTAAARTHTLINQKEEFIQCRGNTT